MSNQTLGQNGIALIRYYEQLRLNAYLDSKGVPTIGWGHTGADVELGLTITRAQAEAFFQADVQKFARDVGGLVKVPLTQNQFDVLVSFAYNAGTSSKKGLASSTLLRQLNQGDYASVPEQMQRWIYITKKENGLPVVVRLEGLVNRRAAEAALWTTTNDKQPSPSGTGFDPAAIRQILDTRGIISGGSPILPSGQFVLVSSSTLSQPNENPSSADAPFFASDSNFINSNFISTLLLNATSSIASNPWGQSQTLPTFASNPGFIDPGYYPPSSTAPTPDTTPTQPVIDPAAEPLPDIEIPAAPSGYDDPWNWLFGSGSFFNDASSFFGSIFDSIFNSGGGYSDIYASWPVVLDLDGDGVSITPLSSSNVFFDMAGDGYQHRTAWAGAGDAVLAFDADGDGKITQKNEIVFTEWDPTATSDMQALRDVFDTNRNGKLDAGDAEFSQFKLIVVNSDGTQTVQTLAQAGVASIGLVENLVTRTFDDGSAIDGETSFTRTDGTTGTAARRQPGLRRPGTRAAHDHHARRGRSPTGPAPARCFRAFRRHRQTARPSRSSATSTAAENTPISRRSPRLQMARERIRPHGRMRRLASLLTRIGLEN